MNHSNKDLFLNQEMDQISEKNVKKSEVIELGHEVWDQKKISWIQSRLDVSKEEALRIYKNSLL